MTEIINEKPIIFDANEVKAALAGNKTQHRVPFDFEFIKDADVPSSQQVADDANCTLSELVTGAYNELVYDFECPFGAKGDRLWVQEQHDRHPDERYFLTTKPHYFADGHLTLDDRHDAGLLQGYCAEDMPRWASRILLEITDIRIERVTEITHSDAIAEHCFNFGEKKKQCIPPLNGFAEYWREKHGDDAWRSNSWVWAIEFKVIDDK